MNNVELYFKTRQIQQMFYVEKAVDRKMEKLAVETAKGLSKVTNKIGGRAVQMLLQNASFLSPVILGQSLEMIFGSFEEEFAQTMTGFNVEAAQLGSTRIFQQMKVLGFNLGAAPINDRVLELIQKQSFEASAITMANIKGDVMASITDSYSKGLGIREAAKELEKEFEEMEEHQLRTIARTEINGNLQLGGHETMNDLGVEYTQWVSAEDSRTRRSHREMNWQITKRNSKYSNGLEHPGDRSGEIEEWINCRCREVPYFIRRGWIAPAGRDWFYEKDLVRMVG